MSKTLYFGNLPWSISDADLSDLVAQHAEVISARVVTDRESGRSRGFGFVEVPEEASESVISALNGYSMDGRDLTVNEARPRESRGGGGGGRNRW